MHGCAEEGISLYTSRGFAVVCGKLAPEIILGEEYALLSPRFETRMATQAVVSTAREAISSRQRDLRASRRGMGLPIINVDVHESLFWV